MKYTMPFQVDMQRLYAAVGSLPCQFPGCGGGCGRVEVSHSNQSQDGKGGGLKAYPWRVAAIGNQHHVEIDSGKHLTRSERFSLWNEAHRSTVGALFARGLVRPVAKLPITTIDEEYL